MTAVKTAIALLLCALLISAQAVFPGSAFASCGAGTKSCCCCKSPEGDCQCGCEMGRDRAPSQPTAPLPATASVQAVSDALAQQVASWSITPATMDLVQLSPVRSLLFPSSAPLYVRFCAQLI